MLKNIMIIYCLMVRNNMGVIPMNRQNRSCKLRCCDGGGFTVQRKIFLCRRWIICFTLSLLILIMEHTLKGGNEHEKVEKHPHWGWALPL